jgi:hypothetical protein
MTFANSAQAKITYYVETTWGVARAAETLKNWRFTQANLNQSKTPLVSEERRSDAQIPFVRHGLHKAGGTVDCELSYLALKDMIALALRYDSTKVAGKLTGAPTVTFTASPKTIVRSAGSWITDGFVAGMKVRVTGAANSANNKVFTIATVTSATVLTVVETPTLDATGNITTTVNGNYIANGVVESSLGVEIGFTDIAQYEVFTGLKFDSFTIDAKTDAIATIQFKLLGKDSSVSGSAIGSGADVDTSQPGDTYSGTMSLGGAASALITTLNMVGNWTRKAAEVLGSSSAAAIFAGRLELKGKMDVYFQDLTVLNLFRNETATSIDFVIQDPAGNQFEITIPAVKIMDAGKQIKGNDAIMLACAWEAYLDTVSGETIQFNMIPAVAV